MSQIFGIFEKIFTSTTALMGNETALSGLIIICTVVGIFTALFTILKKTFLDEKGAKVVAFVIAIITTISMFYLGDGKVIGASEISKLFGTVLGFIIAFAIHAVLLYWAYNDYKKQKRMSTLGWGAIFLASSIMSVYIVEFNKNFGVTNSSGFVRSILFMLLENDGIIAGVYVVIMIVSLGFLANKFLRIFWGKDDPKITDPVKNIEHSIKPLIERMKKDLSYLYDSMLNVSRIFLKDNNSDFYEKLTDERKIEIVMLIKDTFASSKSILEDLEVSYKKLIREFDDGIKKRWFQDNSYIKNAETLKNGEGVILQLIQETQRFSNENELLKKIDANTDTSTDTSTIDTKLIRVNLKNLYNQIAQLYQQFSVIVKQEEEFLSYEVSSLKEIVEKQIEEKNKTLNAFNGDFLGISQDEWKEIINYFSWDNNNELGYGAKTIEEEFSLDPIVVSNFNMLFLRTFKEEIEKNQINNTQHNELLELMRNNASNTLMKMIDQTISSIVKSDSANINNESANKTIIQKFITYLTSPSTYSNTSK